MMPSGVDVHFPLIDLRNKMILKKWQGEAVPCLSPIQQTDTYGDRWLKSALTVFAFFVVVKCLCKHSYNYTVYYLVLMFIKSPPKNL